MVRGITARSRSIVGNIGADIQSLFGGCVQQNTKYIVGGNPIW
ncbi:MAG: hypothetical protein H7Y41_04475 [Hyphomonadaceae bacterium]|nr:hypothetical protein [Clostridia bacterium]